MICVQLTGGLGNQMFQYACGRNLACSHNTELFLDTSRYKTTDPGSTRRSYELGRIFKLNSRIADEVILRTIKPLGTRMLNALSVRFGIGGIQTPSYFIERGFSYNEGIEKTGRNCFLAGYWQSLRYFEGIQSMIRDDFVFPGLTDEANISLFEKIRNSNSVSLHIRRSDYLNNNSNIHGSCSITYYMRAADVIAKKMSSPEFFIFSDDPDWLRGNLDLKYPCEYASGNSGAKSYVDMQLMSMCQHNIIANSSFSWWGAWLNKNPDKIVIAPEKWFIDTTINTKDLIPGNWLRI